jgi:hypothetical protein
MKTILLKSKLALAILSTFCALQSWAADLPGISRIFAQSFWTSHYEERFCGKNIEKLVRKSIKARLDLRDAYIIEITDTSGWMFGMVNALQAREGGRLIEPARTAPARHPGEKNWYFHAVLMVNGKIMDYDFTNQPTLHPLKQYLNLMFIPADKQIDAKYKLSKMKGYKLTLFPAEDYILRQQQRLPTRDVAKEYYLKDLVPDFFQ